MVVMYFAKTVLAPYTEVLISPQPDQEGNKLQRPKSNFCKPLKKNSEGCPSNQFSMAAMTSTSDEKWRPFICFFSRFGLRTYQHPMYLSGCQCETLVSHSEMQMCHAEISHHAFLYPLKLCIPYFLSVLRYFSDTF